MTVEAPIQQLERQKALIQGKISSLQEVSSNITNPEWMHQKILKGSSSAYKLRIDLEQRRENPVQWAENLVRAGTIKRNLSTVKPRYQMRLDEINSQLNFEQSPAGIFIQTFPIESQPLIKDFLKSDGGQNIIDIIRQTPKVNRNLPDFSRAVAGSIFEQLAYIHVKPEYNRGNFILLSPAEVFNLYRQMLPERAVFEGYGLTLGLVNTTIPDGILIEAIGSLMVIRKLFEYKSWVKKLGIRQMLQSVELSSVDRLSYHLTGRDRFTYEIRPEIGPILHSIRPDIPADATLTIDQNLELIYVAPQNSNVQISNIETIKIPIDSHDLFKLIRNLTNASH